VPNEQISSICDRLIPDGLASLRQMVLPAFLNQVVEVIDDQLPSPGLLVKLKDKLLFTTAG